MVSKHYYFKNALGYVTVTYPKSKNLFLTLMNNPTVMREGC